MADLATIKEAIAAKVMEKKSTGQLAKTLLDALCLLSKHGVDVGTVADMWKSGEQVDDLPPLSPVLTDDERTDIAAFLAHHFGEPESVVRIHDTMRGVAVRKYMSDGPGYFGSIYFIVFGGGPEFHMCLTNYKGEGYEVTESEFQTYSSQQIPLQHDPGCLEGERCDCF
jgi:hypothetical protein